MTAGNDRFQHESLEDAETVGAYLAALQEGLETGALTFTSEEQQLNLKPAGLITLKLEARRQGDEVRLTLRLKWNENLRPRQSRRAALKIKPDNR